MNGDFGDGDQKYQKCWPSFAAAPSLRLGPFRTTLASLGWPYVVAVEKVAAEAGAAS